MMYDWGYNNSGYGIWSFIFMLFIMALVIIGVVLVIRYVVLHSTNGSSSIQKEETALDILQKRYARGEIDKKEYEEKKKAIEA